MRLFVPLFTLTALLACETEDESGLGETGAPEDSGEVEDTEPPHTPHWSYDGHDETIPESEWATHWPTCGGEAQSPIDLVPETLVDGSEPDLDWATVPSDLKVAHNGHTLQWTVAPGSTLTLDGVTRPLVQFHLHVPSEHTVSGAAFPMELHFVHVDDRGTETKDDDTYAVIGQLFELGELPDPDLERVGFGRLPTTEGAVLEDSGVRFDPAHLLPPDFAAIPNTARYAGSLTTPPCTESVSWLVSTFPRYLSQAQLDEVEALFDDNARSVQALNGRQVTLWEETAE